MTGRVRICLHGEALRNNVAIARQHAPGARIVAVVKADAYGHGVAFATRNLAGCVDAFAVASVDEGVALRELGVDKPVWILSDFSGDDIQPVLQYRLCPVLHERRQFEAVCDTDEAPPEVVIKIDSGMGRLGFDASQLGAIVDSLRQRRIAVTAVMSHLSNADDRSDPRTTEQIDRFDAATRDRTLERSLANSAGIVAWPASHFDWVRPGIMLYGVSPTSDRTGPDLGLMPAMTLTARILSLRTFQPGQPVGYGGNWVCRRITRAALLSCGYGDGYPRHAPNGTPVLLNEGIAPLIGRVSMDSMAVDISDLGEVDIKQQVVLWGRGLPAEVVAERCGTIAYELFCRVTARPERIEVDHGGA
jgi:alanine racemase